MNGQCAGANGSNRPDVDSTSEAQVDQALEDTFPASDPPFWTLGEPDNPAGAGTARDTTDLRLERERIAFLIDRDGVAAAEVWVRRTMRLYRQAVLDRTGFARTGLYRRSFIQSYWDFKRWLRRVDAQGS